MNPQRKCYMCEATQDYFNLICAMRARDDVEFEDEFGNGEPMDKPFWKTESKEAIAWLMDEVDQCPACALSVLRQGRIFAFEVFDYKKSRDDWYKDERDASGVPNHAF